ncbi:MAG: shikimate kinase, partial [Bauldia litoralis]
MEDTGLTPTPDPKTDEAGESLEARVARQLEGRTLAMVGMMGAGKSSIGRRLAARLGLPFVDADTEIEEAAFELSRDAGLKR